MSLAADFATSLFEKNATTAPLVLEGIDYPAKVEKLSDIRAVIFDVYGTLISYWKPEFANENAKQKRLLSVFKQTAEYFKAQPFLEKMNPDEPAEKTLYDLYHGLIALDHEKSRKKGIDFPEIKIEKIWEIIIMMLKRHGYDSSILGIGTDLDCAFAMAYFYNFHALNGALYPGVVDSLSTLLESQIKLGIVSNGQFYTPLDLTLLLRAHSKDQIDDYLDIFDRNLVYFSYEYGVAKPSKLLFEKLYDALYEYHILPEQTVFVGNDLQQDILPAQEIGMKTAFFTGDCRSAFTSGSTSIIPDIVFKDYLGLPGKITFHGEISS
jgi:putative hydrolase of the HAD superfamily